MRQNIAWLLGDEHNIDHTVPLAPVHSVRVSGTSNQIATLVQHQNCYATRISIICFGGKVNDVKRLLPPCLQNLCSLNFDLGDGLQPPPVPCLGAPLLCFAVLLMKSQRRVFERCH